MTIYSPHFAGAWTLGILRCPSVSLMWRRARFALQVNVMDPLQRIRIQNILSWKGPLRIIESKSLDVEFIHYAYRLQNNEGGSGNKPVCEVISRNTARFYALSLTKFSLLYPSALQMIDISPTNHAFK